MKYVVELHIIEESSKGRATIQRFAVRTPSSFFAAMEIANAASVHVGGGELSLAEPTEVLPSRTVTVSAGPYATVRAVERAQQAFGPDVTVRGLVDASGPLIYEVVSR